MNKSEEIIEALKQAIAGDLVRVTIAGETWVRLDADPDEETVERMAEAIWQAETRYRSYARAAYAALVKNKGI